MLKKVEREHRQKLQQLSASQEEQRFFCLFISNLI